jgi:hypothetical protein
MVDRDSLFGQQRRVSITQRANEEADSSATSCLGHRRQQRPTLENDSMSTYRVARRQVIECPAVIETGAVGNAPDASVHVDGRVLCELQADAQREL